jgi:putative ABC transport system permease protein
VRTAKIVGVAADTDIGSLFSRRGDVVYMPLDQRVGAMTFAIALVRSSSAPSVAVRGLREAVVRTDYDLAIESSGTGTGVLGGPTPFLRAGTAFALSLGGITLLLSMVGLYGVQSHGVERRTREIGVRMSFGATAEQIRTLVLKDGYRPVLQGVAIGFFLGFTGRGLVRAFLWEEIELVDAWMILAVPAPMILATFFACYWPARRASRIDPNVALRHL